LLLLLAVGETEGVDADGRVVRRHGNHLIAVDAATDAANCTVAYMSTCLSVGRCRQACQAMGAARYRWFHADACCQVTWPKQIPCFRLQSGEKVGTGGRQFYFCLYFLRATAVPAGTAESAY